MKRLRKKLLAAAMSLLTLSASTLSPQLLSFSEPMKAEAAYSYNATSIKINGVTYKKKPGNLNWEDGAVAAVAANQSTITIQETIPLVKDNGTKVDAPVTTIGDNFAKGLTNLKKLEIPASIDTIGYNVAYNCDNLETVDFKTTKVEYIDSTFLLGSEYYYTRYWENFDKNGGHVCVGEWLLRYNTEDTRSKVIVKSLSKNGIKKIAAGAFSACSPKLTTVDLSGITHINRYGLGECNPKYYPLLRGTSFSPNCIGTLLNTGSLESLDASSIEGTTYYRKEKLAHKNDTVLYPMVLGKVLYQIIPGSSKGTLDLSKYNNSYDKMDKVQYINCELFPDKFNKYIFPRNFKKFNGLYIPSLKHSAGVQYFNNPSSKTAVDLQKRILDAAYGRTTLNKYDKQFIANTFMQMTGGDNTDASLAITKTQNPYLFGIMEPLGKKFLEDKCLVNPAQKPTDAWSQYNTVRKVICGIRNNDTVNYVSYEKGGAGNAATELVNMLTGASDRRGVICRDYADLFQFLMGLMGITTEKVTSETHEWNTVKIMDGKAEHWFNIDSTKSWSTSNTNFMTNDTVFQLGKPGHVPKKSATLGTQTGWHKCSEGRGDVNRDGKINSADANLILEYYVDEMMGMVSNSLNPYQKVLADVDCNGDVDSADATLILNYYTDVVSKKITNKALETYIAEQNLKEDSAGKIPRQYPHWSAAETAIWKKK